MIFKKVQSSFFRSDLCCDLCYVSIIIILFKCKVDQIPNELKETIKLLVSKQTYHHGTSSSSHMHIFDHKCTLSLSKYHHCINHNLSQLTLTWKMASNCIVILVKSTKNNDSHTKASIISTLHLQNHPRYQVLKAHTWPI